MSRRSPLPALAAVLLLAGVLALVVWRVESGASTLPYSRDAVPPSTAQVTENETYQLAVPGGVPAMRKRGVGTVVSNGVTVLALRCTFTPQGRTGVQSLPVSAESVDTKAENTVGHFVAPVAGAVAVDCDGWGAMFVPDSDDRPFDAAGLAVLVGAVLLTLGGGLAMAAAYRSWRARQETLVRSEPTDEDSPVDS